MLEIPDNSTWDLSSQLGTSTLTFDGFKDGFDLSQAFSIIPRTRLAALLAKSSTLEVQLACNCPVSAFVEQQGFLVIDIFDEIVSEADEKEKAVYPPELNSQFSYGELLWGAEPNESNESNLAPTDTGEKSSKIQPLILESARKQKQMQLLESFSQAASQGLITLQPNSTRQTQKVEGENESQIIYDSSREISELAKSTVGNMRVSDSKDIPKRPIHDNLSSTGEVCPDPSLFNVSSWGTKEMASVQLGKSNKDLYNDMGRIDVTEVKKRAQLYLYLGFGAEAIYTLSLVDGLINRHPELVDLARIMEFGYVKNPRLLNRFADCDSQVALWAMLAAEEIPVNSNVNASAALRGLANLPSHLKYFLAPKLSDRLLKRGDAANAKIAIRSYTDLNTVNELDANLVKAKVYEVQNNREEALEILGDIVDADSSEAPEAISRLVDNYILDGKKVPSEIALLAEAYAFELRNSEYGTEMVKTFIRAAASSGQYQKSINALRNDGEKFRDSDRKDLTSFIFSDFARNSNNVEFVSLFFTHYAQHQEDILPETAVEISSRILTQGFIDKAQEVLNSIPQSVTSIALSELKAKISFQMLKYDEALVHLTDVKSAEAKILRANILEQIGSSLLASEEFNSVDMDERALTALWLAEEWLTSIDDEVPVYGAFAQLAREPQQNILNNNEMLKNSNTAISSSENARVVMRDALQELEISN
ncbi:MAG: hypothetical protein AB8B62_01525 [Roseobacter sp.]